MDGGVMAKTFEEWLEEYRAGEKNNPAFRSRKYPLPSECFAAGRREALVEVVALLSAMHGSAMQGSRLSLLDAVEEVERLGEGEK